MQIYCCRYCLNWIRQHLHSGKHLWWRSKDRVVGGWSKQFEYTSQLVIDARFDLRSWLVNCYDWWSNLLRLVLNIAVAASFCRCVWSQKDILDSRHPRSASLHWSISYSKLMGDDHPLILYGLFAFNYRRRWFHVRKWVHAVQEFGAHDNILVLIVCHHVRFGNCLLLAVRQKLDLALHYWLSVEFY